MNFIPKLPSLVLPQNRTARALMASFVSALILFAGLSVATPANADPAPGVALETFTYTTDEANNVTVTGCVDTCPAALVIPATLGGNPVTEIGDDAFYYKSVTSVVIPENVLTIGNYAFGHNSLTSVVIPENVLSIGGSAFEANSLTSVVIPDSVTVIGGGAFYRNQLTAITIPNSVTSIGPMAFEYNSLTSVMIPSSVVSIGVEAFAINSLTSFGFAGSTSVEEAENVLYGNPVLEFVDVAYGSTGWGQTWSNIQIRVGDAPFTYDTDSSNNVTVTGYAGTVPTDLVIPETLGGNPVTAIGNGAFLEKSLTSVVIPESVLTIGVSAFESNSLTSVTLPASLTTLETACFFGNQLTAITIPDSVTSIGAHAFEWSSLTSVTIPSSVVSFGDEAFAFNSLTYFAFAGNAPISEGLNVLYGNSDLTAVDVPYGSTGWGPTWSNFQVRVGDAPFTYTTDSDNNVTVTGCVGSCPADLVIPSTLGGNPVTAIGYEAFQNGGISSVTIPSSVTNISAWAFYENQLTSVTVPDSVTDIRVGAFYGNIVLSSLTLGSSVTNIETYAFQSNALTSVTLPASLTAIGSMVFADNSLTSVVFEGNAPLVVEDETIFYNNDSLTAIDVSYGTTGWGSTFSGTPVRVGDAPFTYTTDEANNVTVTGYTGIIPTDLVIPSTLGGNPVTAIGEWAFTEAGLSTVIIPNSVTSIGYKAFQNNQLSSLTLPSALTTISEWAFAGNSLTSITFPSTLTSLGQYAFAFNSFTSVTFSGNAVADLAGMFSGNSGLTAVDVSYGSSGWGSTFAGVPVRVGDAPEAFTYTTDEANNVTVTGCYGTCPVDLVIPATLGGNPVTAIADSAFFGKNLTSVIIPDSVISIGDNAFYANLLTSVTIPDSVTSIGDYAFMYNQFTSVTIPDSVTSIGGAAFMYNQLTSATIGNSVTSIGDSAFSSNQLTSITIPDSVTNLGGGAFYNNKLTSATIPDSLTRIAEYVFAYNLLTSVTVPSSVTEIAHYAFGTNQLTSVTFAGDGPTDGGLIFGENESLSAVDVAYGSTGWESTFSGVTVRVGDAPFTYTTDEANNVTVTGCLGTCSVDLVIPATLGGNPVTAIADNAFKGSGLISVVLPDSLVSIGYWAFENNSLTAVTLPASLTTLYAGAFYINALVSVEVPSNVTTVGDYAFARNSLTSVIFNGNAPAEAGGVFESNTDLAVVDVAFGSTGWGATFDGITVRVGDAPFTYTTDEANNVTVDGYIGDTPTDLVIPATLGGNPVTAIYESAFPGRDLTSLTLPASIISIGDMAFASNRLTSLTLPTSLVTIGWNAFAYNQLATVTIPASVTNLGENSFWANLLTSVTFAGNAPLDGGVVFGNNSDLADVRVSYGTTGWESTFSGVTVNVVGAPTPTPTPSVTNKPASAPKIRSTRVGNSQVTLGIWAPRKNGGSEITGYEYTVDDGETWAAVDSSSTPTSLVITGLENGIRYLAKVRAVNGVGGGTASKGKSFTPRTLADAPIITGLTGLSAKIKVELEAPAFNGGSKIIRYAYSINDGAWHSWNAGATGSPQYITGLKSGVECSVRIRAYTAAGWGAISESASATTWPRYYKPAI